MKQHLSTVKYFYYYFSFAFYFYGKAYSYFAANRNPQGLQPVLN